MKKIIVFLIISLFFLFPTLVNATIEGVISAQGVRVRNTSDTTVDTNIVATTSIGDPVILVDMTTYPGTGEGCTNGWYKIIYNSTDAYICSSFVNITKNPEYNTSGWTARTYSNSVNVRNAPNKDATIQNNLILGTNLTILGYSPSSVGCNTSWYNVKYYDGKSTGYVCGDYIVIRNNITTQDIEYENTLTTLGFPESYFPYLSYLHKKFPNWTFNPIQTSLKWDDSINGEMGKNYIQSNNEYYIANNTIAETPNWYKANTSVISFYMDTRNFLNEKHIFMFETLNYDNNYETLYSNIVKSIFEGGTFSNDDFANLLNTSGKANNISPAHLASRIRQEVGTSGNASTNGNTFTWNGTPYSGYYNFFNIGAYGDNPQLRGLAYAAGLVDNPNNARQPWNSVESSINGGAVFLSNGYISKGQYTLYFQKFNTSPNTTNPKYTHQYMTNIQAPSSESSSIYGSYSSRNLLTNPYSFSIPVYSDMPISTSLPSAGSKNNYLSSVLINGKSIVDFDKDVLEYTYFIDKNINLVEIKGTAENSLSLVSGDGSIQLINDTNEIVIIVAAENGEIKTYKINIIKVASIISVEELSNKLGAISGDILSNNSINTPISTLVNKILTNSPSSIITLFDMNGSSIDINSNLKTGQTITVTTTANETKVFKVSVTGDIDGDGLINILDLLKIQRHLVKSKALENPYLTAGDTNNDTEVNILDLLRLQKHILGEIKL